MRIEFDPSERIVGTDTSSVGFEITNDDLTAGNNRNGTSEPATTAPGSFDSCPSRKIKYSVTAQLSLEVDMNYLGGVAAFGYACAGLVILMALSFAVWVWYNRKTRVVSAMQPFFLLELTLGVLLIGSSLIPMSIDDGVTSETGCNIACNSWPWLLSVGFIVSLSAIFSKLWRINKIFTNSQQLRRRAVMEKDVIVPSLVLILLIIIFMLVWTITGT